MPKNQCIYLHSKKLESVSGVQTFQRTMALPWRLGLVLFLVSCILAASLLGTDYTTGQSAITSQWESRRVRLFIAKVLASGLICTAIMWGALIVLLASVYAAASVTGSVEGLDQFWWDQFNLSMLRFAPMPFLAAVLGASIAAVARRSAAAIGLLAVSFAAEEGMSATLFGRQGGLFRNLDRFLSASVGDHAIKSRTGSVRTVFEHSTLEAGLVVLLSVGFILGIAVLVCRFRDQT